ncbi:MAG: hypothetical protein V4519_03185 [Patescibacteria group bacterium]
MKEVSTLLTIDIKTCSRWINEEGLEVLEKNMYPILIMGSSLKTFLLLKRAVKKVSLKDDEFYCCKCKKAVRPKRGSKSVQKTGKYIGKENKEQLVEIGICEICGTKINKFLRVCQKD